jgi:uncharacterized protein
VDSLKPTESNTVTGAAFFDRVFDRAHVREKVENGEPLLLTGQRRMGKSSLAREIGRALTEEQGDLWSFVFVDIQACSSGEELVARLADEIQKHPDFKSKIKAWLKPVLRIFGRIEKISAGEFSVVLRESLNASNWQDIGAELLKKIASSEKRTLLVLDEFPDVIVKINRSAGRSGVEQLLDWLRPLVQELAANRKISIILSGSIGLEPVLQRLHLTTKINHFAIHRLKPWDRPTAKSCFNALANYRNISVDDRTFDYFLDQLGIYIPQHIQQCWAKLDAHLRTEQKATATRTDAEHVFNNVILRAESDTMVSHYEHRLNETLGDNYFEVAIKLLDQLCDGQPFTHSKFETVKAEHRDDIDLHYLLGVLVHDGYLSNDETQWVFDDSLLRKWWRGRKKFRSKA